MDCTIYAAKTNVLISFMLGSRKFSQCKEAGPTKFYHFKTTPLDPLMTFMVTASQSAPLLLHLQKAGILTLRLIENLRLLTWDIHKV